MSDQISSEDEAPAETIPDLLIRLNRLVLAQDAKVRELEEALMRASQNGSRLRHVMRYDDGVVARARDVLTSTKGKDGHSLR